MIRFAFAALLFLAAPVIAQEAEPEPGMTLDRLEEIILRLDPDAQRQGGAFQFAIEDVPVLIVTDERADRMRAMTPIRSADALTPEELARMMQANFDTALDARYAIANGRLWSAFIHPLSPLEREQFIEGEWISQRQSGAQIGADEDKVPVKKKGGFWRGLFWFLIGGVSAIVALLIIASILVPDAF